VLIAHLAASTSTIKVGSGGVMLPNHAPLVIAEQFAMLEALHPGRIDLGIGRAPGTDPATAAALRRSPDLGAEDFPRDLLEVMGLLGDERVEPGSWSRLRATPVATSAPQIVLLGSSGYSAQLAGQLGLGFGFAHHFDLPGVMAAVTLYRDHFRPSPALAEPYTIVTAGVLAADDAALAEHLAGPARLAVLGIRTGRRTPLLHPDDAAVHPDIDTARAMPSNRIVGDGEHVAAELRALAASTGAAEIMVSTMTHGLPERIRTLELIAEHWPR
jgi:luciferase family oxidoreductase group 1